MYSSSPEEKKLWRLNNFNLFVIWSLNKNSALPWRCNFWLIDVYVGISKQKQKIQFLLHLLCISIGKTLNTNHMNNWGGVPQLWIIFCNLLSWSHPVQHELSKSQDKPIISPAQLHQIISKPFFEAFTKLAK